MKTQRSIEKVLCRIMTGSGACFMNAIVTLAERGNHQKQYVFFTAVTSAQATVVVAASAVSIAVDVERERCKRPRTRPAHTVGACTTCSLGLWWCTCTTTAKAGTAAADAQILSNSQIDFHFIFKHALLFSHALFSYQSQAEPLVFLALHEPSFSYERVFLKLSPECTVCAHTTLKIRGT